MQHDFIAFFRLNMRMSLDRVDLMDDENVFEIPEDSEKEAEEQENYYLYRLRDVLNLDVDEKTINTLQQNYPHKTRKEIFEALENQLNYKVIFHHQHEGVTDDLIKKYLLLDEYDYDSIKVTIKTPEIHDCNLVKLTPELQEKSYWGYRGDRTVVSHLIDREDYPYENKTNKLTIIGRRVFGDWDDEPCFLVVTAFWGNGLIRPEIKEENLEDYTYQDMEYWMNHALIPEKNEDITKTDSPNWIDEYQTQKKQKNHQSIYAKYQSDIKEQSKLHQNEKTEYESQRQRLRKSKGRKFKKHERQ